jgi:phosphocarrier protein
MLAAGKGTIIKVTIRGEDSDKASDALTDLINRKFDED